MSKFRFRSPDGHAIAPQEWLHVWAARYTKYDEVEYEDLRKRHRSFKAEDFERIGRWKDDANTVARWKPNVASVAYIVWNQAASELPGTIVRETITDAFLTEWSGRKYVDELKNGGRRAKHFGLSRATTLLHFMSGGEFPIFDSRVRRAAKRLSGSLVPYTVRGYFDSYCPLFQTIATSCGSENQRALDKALFCYGDKQFTE